MTTDQLSAHCEPPPSLYPVARERRVSLGWQALATVAAIVAFTGASAWILSNSSSRVYGFVVSHDIRTLIEIALQICPMLAAFVMVLVSPGRDRVTGWLGRRLTDHHPKWQPQAARTLAMLMVNAMLAIVLVAATACAVATVSGRQAGAPGLLTLLWVASELAIDMALIGIFTTTLYALTRRLWVTFLLFLLYVIVVITTGPKWGITSYIGFGSGVPVLLTTYSAAPLYDTAGWWFRGYWTCAAALMVSILHAFDDPSRSLVKTAMDSFRGRNIPGRALVSAGFLIVWIAFGVSLLSLQRYGIAKYVGPSQAALEVAVRGDTTAGRLHITDFDLRLDYAPSRNSVRVEGVVTLANGSQPLRTAYFQAPALMQPGELQLTGVGPYEVREVGKYIQVTFRDALGADKSAEVRYAGVIRPAGPFDLNIQAKVLGNAFFLTDSDVLMLPRSAGCLTPAASQREAPANDSVCGPAENYLMSDRAKGRITVTAPVGLRAVGPGEHSVRKLPRGNLEEHVFHISRPQLTTFMVACAPFAETVTASRYGEATIRAYRSATASDRGQSEATLAQSILSFYGKAWPAYGRRDLQIIEMPTPLGEAMAFDGVIAVSDRIIASRNPISGAASNLLEFVMAHELAHQWWGYRVVPARSSGRQFLLESIPQFAAYKYLHHRGILREEEAMRNEKRRYESARARTGTKEVTLAQFEARPEYAYNKGPFILLSLDRTVGPNFMNRLGELIARHSHESYGNAEPDSLVATILENLPESERQVARALIYRPETGAPR